MEIETMGKVLVRARVENLFDLYELEKGSIQPDDVRTIEIEDALVDTGATLLSLPKRYIGELGLSLIRSRTARTVAGMVRLNIYGTVRLTVQGRDVNTDVCEVPDDCPALIGQIPLEGLDFVVDLSGQKLIGNPDHGGEAMIDLFSL